MRNDGTGSAWTFAGAGFGLFAAVATWPQVQGPKIQWPQEQPEQLEELHPPQSHEPALEVKPESLLWAKTDMHLRTRLDPHPGHLMVASRSNTSSSNSFSHLRQMYS